MTALNDAERAAISRDAEGKGQRGANKAVPARIRAAADGGAGSRFPKTPAWLPSRRFIAAVIAIGGIQLLATMDSTVAIVALPKIQDELSLSDAGRSWVITAYVLTFGGLMLLGGRLGDVIGRKRTFVVGVALFTIASILCGLAWNEATLVTARLLQGVGAAIASPTALALIATTFPKGPARNAATAIFAAMTGVGSVMGLIVANANLASYTELYRFKEHATILLVSGVFIILAAGIDFAQLSNLSLRAALLIAAIILIVRPATVMLSLWGTNLPMKERLLIAFTGPRGVVLVAVSGIFAERLVAEGVPDGALIAPLAFVLVLATVPLFAALLCIPFAIIGPIIVAICLVGAYTVSGKDFDLWLALVLGLVGYLLTRLDYPLAPLILAMVLGHKAENAFHQSMILSDGSLSIFFSNPLVATIMVVGLALMVLPRLGSLRRRTPPEVVE